MRKEKTKEEIIRHANACIGKLNSLFQSYTITEDPKLLKKADLLSYWLEQFSDYIMEEDNFNPTALKSYKRGDIVKLNFGFNVGSEYGGLHYGVVINNSNPHNSKVLTVIPLTSYKQGQEIHHDDVFLGNELYKLLKLKHDTLSQSINAELKEAAQFQQIMMFMDNMLQKSSQEVKDVNALMELKRKLKSQHEKTLSDKQQLDKIGKEISHMKSGSIAIASSIMTVSKMRIYDPRNARGVLHGIRLSADSMNTINEKMKELFIFS